MTQVSRSHATAVFKLGLVAVVSILAACAAPKPVLYSQNAADANDAKANRAIQACIDQAKARGLNNAGHPVVRRTVEGGAIGAAGGAVGGAIYGSPGRGAAVGAAGSATVGFIRGLLGGHKPSPVFKRYVDRCLRDRGYDPIGWQ